MSAGKSETGGCLLYATQEFNKTANNSNNNFRQTSSNATSFERRCRRSGSGHSNKNNQKLSRSNNKNAWPLSASSAFTFTSAIASAFPASKSFHSAFEKNHKISSHKQLLTFLLVTMTLVVILQQQQITANPLPSKNRVAVASPSPSAAATTPAKAVVAAEVISAAFPIELNSRLRKRHSSWHELYAREMNSHEMEWANPCGGEWHLNDSAEQRVSPSHRTAVKKILRLLQNSTGKEQKTIKINAPVINISDISMWSLHKEAYKFLPVLKINSNVALRRWHRQMQLYVASFAYLRRAQMIWDHSKLQHESAISKELLKLKQSSRSILCEIETAINNTSPSSMQRNAQTTSHRRVTHHKRLIFLSRDAMEKRLRFQTNIKDLFRKTEEMHDKHRRHHSQDHFVAVAGDDELLLPELHPIDLKFAKYRYFGYLRAMLKLLRSHARRFTAIRTTKTPFSSQENNRAQMEHEKRSKNRSIHHKKNNIKNGSRKRSRKSKFQNLQKEKERQTETESYRE